MDKNDIYCCHCGHKPCRCKCQCGCGALLMALLFVKLDSANGEPLADAWFSLTGKSETQAAATDSSGVARFRVKNCVQYTLAETEAPKGYLLDANERVVMVDCLGHLYVDGVLVDGLTLYNEPFC